MSECNDRLRVAARGFRCEVEAPHNAEPHAKGAGHEQGTICGSDVHAETIVVAEPTGMVIVLVFLLFWISRRRDGYIAASIAVHFVTMVAPQVCRPIAVILARPLSPTGYGGLEGDPDHRLFFVGV